MAEYAMNEKMQVKVTSEHLDLCLAKNISLSQVLEDEFGTLQVGDTQLDAFDRAMITAKFYTKTNGEKQIEASKVEAFMNTETSRVLLQEFVSRTLQVSLKKTSILPYLIGSEMPITGDSMRMPKFDLMNGTTKGKKNEKALQDVRVSELADIPVHDLMLSDTATTIYKYGNGIKVSYEFARRTTIDMIRLFIDQRADVIAARQSKDIIQLIQKGDNSSAAAKVYKSSTFDPTAIDGKVTPKAFLSWILENNPYIMDTVLVDKETYIQLAMMWNDTNGVMNSITPGVAFKMPQNIFQDVTVIYTDDIIKEENKPTIVGLKRSMAIVKITERGSMIQEQHRNPTNQSTTLYMTENAGFHKLDDSATTVLQLA